MRENNIIKRKNIKMNKIEIMRELKNLNLNFDVSSLPDNVVISGYEIDITNPDDPIFRVTHSNNN